jgi:hypothetical protein
MKGVDDMSVEKEVKLKMDIEKMKQGFIEFKKKHGNLLTQMAIEQLKKDIDEGN